MGPKKSLCVFLVSGRTFTFRNVKVVVDNETIIVFEYLAMSDGLKKSGVFYKQHIVGISTTEEEVKF